jgi:hypothetical protein
MQAKGGVREATLSVQVTRADGTVENLGIVAYHHESPFRRLIWHARQIMRKGR